MERRDDPRGAGLLMVDLHPRNDAEALFVVVFEHPQAPRWDPPPLLTAPAHARAAPPNRQS